MDNDSCLLQRHKFFFINDSREQSEQGRYFEDVPIRCQRGHSQVFATHDSLCGGSLTSLDALRNEQSLRDLPAGLDRNAQLSISHVGDFIERARIRNVTSSLTAKIDIEV